MWWSRSAVPRETLRAQPASIDMGLHIGNGVSLDAADDAGDVPHRRNVRVSDVPCDGRTAPERWNV